MHVRWYFQSSFQWYDHICFTSLHTVILTCWLLFVTLDEYGNTWLYMLKVGLGFGIVTDMFTWICPRARTVSEREREREHISYYCLLSILKLFEYIHLSKKKKKSYLSTYIYNLFIYLYTYQKNKKNYLFIYRNFQS